MLTDPESLFIYEQKRILLIYTGIYLPVAMANVFLLSVIPDPKYFPFNLFGKESIITASPFFIFFVIKGWRTLKKKKQLASIFCVIRKQFYGTGTNLKKKKFFYEH